MTIRTHRSTHRSAIRTVERGFSLPLAATLGLAAGLALAATPALPAAHAGNTVTVDMIGTDGETMGTATFTQSDSGIVVIEAEVSGLDDGEHGFHIHETGLCEPDTGFKSAGGHYVGADDPKHGLVEGGPHAGDLPNVTAENGSFVVEHFNPRVTLAGDMNPLDDADGSALMVHSKADDYESQPSGAAGDRVACGVIFAAE